MTNPSKFLKGDKPILTEHGPYTFREINEKTNVKFMRPNKISYKPQSTLFYEPSMSVNIDEDMFYFLDVPSMVTMKRIKFSTSNVFFKKPAREIIFGIESDVMKLGAIFTSKKATKFALVNRVGFA